jgi:hypothetical protein
MGNLIKRAMSAAESGNIKRHYASEYDAVHEKIRVLLRFCSSSETSGLKMV